MASALYFFFGLLVLSYNSSSSLHRVLFCSFLCLSWWAFAFNVANIAPDYETALLWRRLAAAGWGIYYSLLLHYILILTGKHALLQKYWLYLLLYLPAALNVFLYGIYAKTASASYQLIKTQAGWVNIVGAMPLDWPHYISYIGFSLAGIIILLHWGITAQEQTKRRTAILIGSAAFLALFIGTMTDHLLSDIFRMEFPQLGPVVILFPALVMFYCIRRYGLMRPTPKTVVPAKNQILSESVRLSLQLYLAMALSFGGLISFAALFFTNSAPLAHILAIVTVFMVAGGIIYLLRSLNLQTDTKDNIVGVVLAVTLPVLTVLIYELTEVHTWTLPVMFVLLAIIFGNKKIVVLMGISVLFSLVWSWVRTPILPLILTGVDHAVRMAALMLIFSFVFYLNHVFKRAIADSQENAIRAKLLSDVSGVLITATESNIDNRIHEVLAMWGNHFHANYVDIFFLDHAQKTLKSTYRWCALGIRPAASLGSTEKEEVFAAALGLNQLGDEIHPARRPHADALVGSETEDRWTKKIENGILTIIPSKIAEQMISIVLIEKHASNPGWQEEELRMCRIVARMITDVWLKIETDRQIKHDAYHDGLTGLPNRQHFIDRLKQAINMATRTQKLVGVIFLDLDSFKSVNDTMGHTGGDVLLRQIGQELRKSVREYDVVARFGGDEFLIMLPQADDIGSIERVAVKVLDTFKAPVAIGEQEFSVTVSMGIAIFPVDGDEPDALLKNADIAMYASKGRGKNKYAFCTDTMKEEARINILLTNDLHRALERNELFLHYQPQLEAATEEIIGAEALLRWRHPRLGMIPPTTFIPLAERTGQISNIGAWVINQACFQNKRWQHAGLKPITMAVNLSPGQFLDGHLVDAVQNALAESRLNPQFLELEITENIAAHDAHNIAFALGRLKALGVRIAIDDFGSGYSSLDRFKSLPVDKLKIDMRFVRGIGIGNKDEEIIKVILQLGKTFGTKVLAEGVEDEKQLSFLRENFCDEVQGFYYYKPMAADEMGGVLQKNRGN